MHLRDLFRCISKHLIRGHRAALATQALKCGGTQLLSDKSFVFVEIAGAETLLLMRAQGISGTEQPGRPLPLALRTGERGKAKEGQGTACLILKLAVEGETLQEERSGLTIFTLAQSTEPWMPEQVRYAIFVPGFSNISMPLTASSLASANRPW